MHASHRESDSADRSAADDGASRDALLGEVRRLRRQLQLRDDMREHFLAMASHELRTPLTAIYGFASTLRERWDALPERSRLEYVVIIEQQADRLAGLVADILTMSRIDGGRMPIRARAVDVRLPAEHAIASVGARDVSLVCAAPIEVLADEVLLERALRKLISNALKHGAEPVTVEAVALDGLVELRVRDHGPGVPAAFEPMLFEAGLQMPTPAEPDPTGIGLGLALAQRLVEAQQGTVRYERAEPSGACFVVSMPAAEQ
ncbi:MAG: histidine kinase [Thermoleophilia bacterium]|nr:histidine kinase [Thermoleophilia bacterium]